MDVAALSLDWESPRDVSVGRRVLVFLLALALLAGITLFEPSAVHPASASTGTCVAGMLVTGVGAIALAIAPPAGIAAVFSWAAAGGGAALTAYDCVTSYNAGKTKNKATCYRYTGTSKDSKGKLYGHYAGGCFKGGGGGGVGSW